MDAGNPNRVVLVSSLPLTGSARLQTETMVSAMQMAMEDHQGKAGPFQVEYRSWDDSTVQAGSWDAGQERSNAVRAVQDPDVMVYLGTYNSGAAKVSIPILNRAGMAMISPGASYSGLTKEGLGEAGEPQIYAPSGEINFTRVVAADDLQGRAGAWWVHQLGLKRVFLLDDQELYGKGIARVFRGECQNLGLTLVGQESIDGRSPDFRSVARKIRDSGAELVYFGGTIQNGAGRLLKDLRETNPGLLFMGPDSLKDSAFLDAAGEAAEGCLVTATGLPPEQMSPSARRWMSRYEARFHRKPEAFTIYAYEATQVALAAIERAGIKDRAAIRRAVLQTRNFPGLLGSWSFDQRGDISLTQMSGYRIQDRGFRFERVLEPGPGQAVGGLSAESRPTSPAAAPAEWSSILWIGLCNGCLIAIVALGYSLVYGLVEVVNFAHSEVFAWGGLLALTGIAHGPLAGLALAMLGASLINLSLERGVYRHMRGGPPLPPMMAALGTSLILKNLAGFWQGWAPVSFPKTQLPSQTLVLATTLPLLLALHLFIQHTRLGKAMRATGQNPRVAQLMGINTEATIAWAFLLGGGLAGAGAWLYGLYNQQVSFDMGFRMGLNAFAAAVVGGIGNPWGAVVGGLLIGMLEALSGYFLSQALAPAVVYASLILILMFLPQGLLGNSNPEKV